MNLGITGHQNRPGINWKWVQTMLASELIKLPQPLVGYSSLAEGADQVFARTILEIGGTLHAIIPTLDYEGHFSGASLDTYHALLRAAEVTQLDTGATDQLSFLNAGRYIVDNVDLLVAIWDGEPAQGLGGTADIGKYAQKKHMPILHINPRDQTVYRRG